MNLSIIDAIWIALPFLMGLLMNKINLPSLIGFLISGFILNYLNLVNTFLSEQIEYLSEIGILLLLFTIGLKIKIKNILKKEIFITASSHLLVSTVLIGIFIFELSHFLNRYFGNLSILHSLLISFALSFSSTVFVVKTLENRGEISSFHGKIAVGILIIQDIFAILFITFSSPDPPSIYSFLIPIYLLIIKWILEKILDQCGHGELLTLFGFFASLVTGALVFKLVRLKPDLGALIMGMILVNHKKSDELHDHIMKYKDFFLIAFFIKIGLIGIPTFKHFIVVLYLIPLIFLKGALFIFFLSKFQIRPRTIFLTSLILINYSEFALIVAFVGFKIGWITSDWLLIFSLLVSISYLVCSVLNYLAHNIFDRYRSVILKLSTEKQYLDEEPKSIGNAEYLIIGFGSIGKPAYQYIQNKFVNKIIAIDYDHEKVKKYKIKGYNIHWGDTTNSIFWETIDFSKVKLILLAMSDFHSNLNSLNEIIKLKNRNFKISSFCKYIDEAKILKEKHVDYIYDYKSNLGKDFAEQSLLKFANKKNSKY